MLQLYLYAQSNGKTTLTLDEVSSSSIPIYNNNHDKSCNKLFDPAAFYVFHILCWLLPIAFYLFVLLIIQSCRPKIRHMLDPPTAPGSSNNPNYAAFILVGLIFSTYVIVCDCFAIKTIADDSELNSLDKYEDSAVRNFTKSSIIVIFVVDIIFSFISLMNIFTLFSINSCNCCKPGDGKTCSCCQSCCICCFFFWVLWRILDCQKKKNNYIQLTSQVEEAQDDNTLKDITSETTAWLLMTSFVAPIVCLGTHSGFVLIAWASDPNAAGSMTIFFVLSFLYYFFGFRQLYIVLASRRQGKAKKFCSRKDKEECTLKSTCTCIAQKIFCCSCERNGSDEDRTCTYCCITCKCYTIREVGEELDQHHKSLKHFNFKILCYTLPLAFILIGAHGLIIAAYVLLPSSLTAVPSSLLNILHWVLIIGSGLIAYKLLTLHAPYEEIIGKNLLNNYDPTIIAKDYPKELGRIFGEALKKYNPPRATQAPALSTPNNTGNNSTDTSNTSAQATATSTDEVTAGPGADSTLGTNTSTTPRPADNTNAASI